MVEDTTQRKGQCILVLPNQNYASKLVIAERNSDKGFKYERTSWKGGKDMNTYSYPVKDFSKELYRKFSFTNGKSIIDMLQPFFQQMSARNQFYSVVTITKIWSKDNRPHLRHYTFEEASHRWGRSQYKIMIREMDMYQEELVKDYFKEFWSVIFAIFVTWLLSLLILDLLPSVIQIFYLQYILLPRGLLFIYYFMRFNNYYLMR